MDGSIIQTWRSIFWDPLILSANADPLTNCINNAVVEVVGVVVVAVVVEKEGKTFWSGRKSTSDVGTGSSPSRKDSSDVVNGIWDSKDDIFSPNDVVVDVVELFSVLRFFWKKNIKHFLQINLCIFSIKPICSFSQKHYYQKSHFLLRYLPDFTIFFPFYIKCFFYPVLQRCVYYLSASHSNLQTSESFISSILD